MKLLIAVMFVFAAAAQEQKTEAPAPAAGQPAPAPTPAADQKAESPAPPSEDWFTGSVDLGYRWLTDIRGSMPTYRSIVNLGEGPKLFGVDFSIVDPKKRLFDRLEVRASEWGDPYNTAHLDARKSGVYDFSADYRNIAYFNAMPSFANTFAPAGFNEQSFDIHRRMADVDLEFFPGKHIVPYLMYGQNSGYGHDIATWAVDANNEYAVPSLLRDSTNNYRGGVRFEYTRFHVTLEEGGTTFKDDSQGYDNIPNSGDRAAALLGQTLLLNNFSQAYAIRGHSTYSRGLITATPYSWITLTGQFLYSLPKTDVHYTDNALGNLELLNAFYSGITDIGTANATQPHVTANAGFELRPLPRLRIVESWMTDRYHDAAFGALSTYLSTKSAQVFVPTSLPVSQIVNFNQQQIDAMYDLTSRITLRGGYRHVWGDATVRAGQLSQTGNLASGDLRRDVALAGASFRPVSKLRMNVEYEGGLSDAVYFRTSLNNYNKARVRAQFQATSTLSLTANFRLLNNQNPASSVRYDFQTQDEGLTISWTPNNSKRIRFLGEYDHTFLHSTTNYISLPFFTNAVSSYRDNAHMASSTVSLALPGYAGLTPRLEFGGSLFVSSGSRPTQFYQPLGRLSLPFSKHVAWNTEWRWYGFGEPFYLYEGFRVHAFTTGIHLSR